ncbi:MAG: adenylyl-sulfate kinase [Polyangiaceae bacterium]|nr:adenylyl-sulfate kinase [Polyangiaceae bacterium]
MSNGGAVVWITGLPSSGKSALAERLRKRFLHAHRPTVVLDGDAVRAAIKPAVAYDEQARSDFYETLANLAALFAAQGLMVIVPATAHLRKYRDRAKELAPRYIEVYVHVSPARCAERDAKGLYAAVREGKVTGLPGADLPYDVPEAPDVIALGGFDDEAIGKIVRLA